MRCKIGHVTFIYPNKSSPRSPPCGGGGLVARKVLPELVERETAGSTRWTTIRSSKVNLLHFWATCGANLVTRWSRFTQERGERNPCNPPCDVGGLVARKVLPELVERETAGSTRWTTIRSPKVKTCNAQATLGPYVVQIWSRNVHISEQIKPAQSAVWWGGP